MSAGDESAPRDIWDIVMGRLSLWKVPPLPLSIGTFTPELGDVGRDFWGRLFIWTGVCWLGTWPFRVYSFATAPQVIAESFYAPEFAFGAPSPYEGLKDGDVVTLHDGRYRLRRLPPSNCLMGVVELTPI